MSKAISYKNIDLQKIVIPPNAKKNSGRAITIVPLSYDGGPMPIITLASMTEEDKLIRARFDQSVFDPNKNKGGGNSGGGNNGGGGGGNGGGGGAEKYAQNDYGGNGDDSAKKSHPSIRCDYPNEELTEFVKKLDARILELAMSRRDLINIGVKADAPDMEAKLLYRHSHKAIYNLDPDSEYAPSLGIKLRKAGGKDATQVWVRDEDGENCYPGTVEDMTSNSRFAMAVKLSCIWVSSMGFGTSFVATFVLVMHKGDALADPTEMFKDEIAELGDNGVSLKFNMKRPAPDQSAEPEEDTYYADQREAVKRSREETANNNNNFDADQKEAAKRSKHETVNDFDAEFDNALAMNDM